MGAPGIPPAYGVAPYYATPSVEQETQVLKSQAEHIEGTLEEIRKRLAELEVAKGKEG
jgi:hypothetical protein